MRYFINSADGVAFFLEPSAVDAASEIRRDVPKGELLNKVGHGLPVQSAVFRDYAQSRAVAEIARDLGYVRPVLPQSMYIFKQPNGLGEEALRVGDRRVTARTTPGAECQVHKHQRRY